MAAIISIIIPLVFSVLLYKQIRKYDEYMYILFTVICVMLYFADFPLINLGFIGFGFFVLVMYARILPKGKLKSRLFYVRTQLSILGFIALLPHAVYYISDIVGLLDSMDDLVTVTGVIAMLIMVPLFVTSFGYFKKKLKNGKWKKIQRYSYLVYYLTFVHLVLINGEHTLIYIVIFGYYFIRRTVIAYKSERISVGVKNVLLLFTVINIAVFSMSYLKQSDLLEFESSVTQLEDIDLSMIEDGTYYGSASGFKDLILEVNVVMIDGEIYDIEIIEDGSTPPKRGVDFEAAVVLKAEEMIEENSYQVDNYSGATKSVQGLKEAVFDALEEQV